MCDLPVEVREEGSRVESVEVEEEEHAGEEDEHLPVGDEHVGEVAGPLEAVLDAGQTLDQHRAGTPVHVVLPPAERYQQDGHGNLEKKNNPWIEKVG